MENKMATPLGHALSTKGRVVSQCDQGILKTPMVRMVIQFDQEGFESSISQSIQDPHSMRKHRRIRLVSEGTNSTSFGGTTNEASGESTKAAGPQSKSRPSNFAKANKGPRPRTRWMPVTPGKLKTAPGGTSKVVSGDFKPVSSKANSFAPGKTRTRRAQESTRHMANRLKGRAAQRAKSKAKRRRGAPRSSVVPSTLPKASRRVYLWRQKQKASDKGQGVALPCTGVSDSNSDQSMADQSNLSRNARSGVEIPYDYSQSSSLSDSLLPEPSRSVVQESNKGDESSSDASSGTIDSVELKVASVNMTSRRDIYPRKTRSWVSPSSLFNPDYSPGLGQILVQQKGPYLGIRSKMAMCSHQDLSTTLEDMPSLESVGSASRKKTSSMAMHQPAQ